MGLAMALGPRIVRRATAALTDVMQVLPWLYLLLAFRAMLPLSLPASWAMAAIVGVLVAAGWAATARVVAGEARTLATAEFLDAARAAGATPGRILWHHVFRHIWPVLAAQATVILPRFVLAEVTLSFLGLGMGEPTPSLGALLSPLREPGIVSSYWWIASPAALLVALFALYHAATPDGATGARA
jgi:peptide/nickel transport system permease protein